MIQDPIPPIRSESLPPTGQARVFAALRVACFTITFVYGCTSANAAPYRAVVLYLSGIFAGYSIAAYLIWRHLFPEMASIRLHTILCGVDFAFVVLLLALTGDIESALSRGLYIWVAIAAIIFGYRAGWIASVAAGIAFIAIECSHGWALDAWERTFYLGGFLVHGPFIGAVSRVQRVRTLALEDAHRRLSEVHARLRTHQTKAIETEKMATLGLVGASLAHEINNPLMGMYACLRGLRKSALSAERRIQYLDTVDEALDRIRQSVQAVLTYTRPGPQRTERTALRDLVAASALLVRPIGSKKAIRFDLSAVESRTIWVPRGQLEQALVNLLLNAVYASPQAGRIGVTAHLTESEVVFSVADEGNGFDPAIMSAALEPFVTTKPEGEGTGLGLSVTDGIMRGLGGSVTLGNQETGAIVTLRFPISNIQIQEAE